MDILVYYISAYGLFWGMKGLPGQHWKKEGSVKEIGRGAVFQRCLLETADAVLRSVPWHWLRKY